MSMTVNIENWNALKSKFTLDDSKKGEREKTLFSKTNFKVFA